MNERQPISEEELDALVRANLERRAEAVDPRPRLARIAATLHGTTDTPTLAKPASPRISRPTRRWGQRWLWGVAAAAAVVLAFVGGLQIGPAQASPQALVSDAQKVHLLPLDRCYLVEVRQESGWPNEDMPETPPSRVTRLWTRGDRFWIESVNAQKRWAWGRDEHGGIWLTWGPNRGVRLDADEVPRWLSLVGDVNSMQLETLLSEVLGNFDLRREGQGADTLPTTYLIRATPRSGHGSLGIRSVLLEVDAETKVLRRVVISRVRLGQPLATTTYSLVESATQPDAHYLLEGHLREPFEVYTRVNQPERRADTLTRLYGPRAEKWFKPPQPN